jgi:hypothetical protein
MSHSNISYPFDKTFDFKNRKRTLKPSSHVRFWIEKTITEYGQQIGITPHEMPNIVFTRRELLAMPKELTAGRRTVSHKYLGICFRSARTILINVKKHTSYEDLKHTIVHELVHYRFRYLKHGMRFENRISLIQRGKRYKVKILYPENPPLSPSHTLQRILHYQQACCKYVLGSDAESRFWIVNYLWSE